MALKPGEEIGLEIHDDRDQFFRVEKGSGEVLIDGVRTAIKGDDGIIVPAGAQHNIVNTGDKLLQLYTIYGPPEQIDGTIPRTQADAEATQQHLDGRTKEKHDPAGPAQRHSVAPGTHRPAPTNTPRHP